MTGAQERHTGYAPGAPRSPNVRTTRWHAERLHGCLSVQPRTTSAAAVAAATARPGDLRWRRSPPTGTISIHAPTVVPPRNDADHHQSAKRCRCRDPHLCGRNSKPTGQRLRAKRQLVRDPGDEGVSPGRAARQGWPHDQASQRLMTITVITANLSGEPGRYSPDGARSKAPCRIIQTKSRGVKLCPKLVAAHTPSWLHDESVIVIVHQAVVHRRHCASRRRRQHPDDPFWMAAQALVLRLPQHKQAGWCRPSAPPRL